MPDAVTRIEQLIAPSLEAMGYTLVRVRVGGGRNAALQIMAERHDGSMTVEDCAEVSRVVSAILDVEDPISGPYTLEVSSPGIDRPLTRLADFQRFAGFEAKFEMTHPVGGRKRFRGKIRGVEAESVRLEHEGGEVVLPFAAIAAAKLVITDALMDWDLKERERREQRAGHA